MLPSTSSASRAVLEQLKASIWEMLKPVLRMGLLESSKPLSVLVLFSKIDASELVESRGMSPIHQRSPFDLKRMVQFRRYLGPSTILSWSKLRRRRPRDHITISNACATTNLSLKNPPTISCCPGSQLSSGYSEVSKLSFCGIFEKRDL